MCADEDLVPLMARGDARAFETIYERHSGGAYSLAYRMVGTRERRCSSRRTARRRWPSSRSPAGSRAATTRW
jgi:DNA-directed RNA polymerase specialized sigma24 family protein